LTCRIGRISLCGQDYQNEKLKEFCEERGIPLADICSLLWDEHFGDELHPNDLGAKIIAETVFEALGALCDSRRERRIELDV